MFQKILIANRGEIACRIQRTCRELGIPSLAVYSEVDANARHVTEADEALCLGPGPASESYLNIPRILEVAAQTGCDAVHPGYGFLSENADFAETCAEHSITFIGPQPDLLRAFGLKHRARALAAEHGVPLVPGSEVLSDADHAADEAKKVGYPVMLKSSGGGGGIGMARCNSEVELRERFDQIARMAERNFASSAVFLEAFITPARHIEVQFFGDGKGGISILGERDCSPQRRNQKVVEESPAPGLDEATRTAMFEATRTLMGGVQYASAGTLEYVYDTRNGQWYFLEVNTRLQVEHPVTECLTGVDLVEWMIRQAAALPLNLTDPSRSGHAMEARVYAEDPGEDFRPSAGLVSYAKWPDDIRVDAWVESGSTISPFYDAMIAKLIVHADTREAAIIKLETALAKTEVHGVQTNLPYLRQIIAHPDFRQGALHTRMLDDIPASAALIDVLDGGTQTSVQAWPGRIGYWHVGVPPSGPMDDFSFRLANRLLGNPSDAAGLECAVNGPTLSFRSATTVCLSGADMQATLNNEPLDRYTPTAIQPGDLLRLSAVEGPGQRSYIAVAGGFDIADYLGSRATFMLGQFGGHCGRAIHGGDVLRLRECETSIADPLPADSQPDLTQHWQISVMYGPHGAPDFFTDEDIDTFFAHHWEVHHNSDRTGVRLVGPKPDWARSDGGEAGLHPSNIHDNAYAIGSIDFTGDMPVILGPDGPSLGGFVCPATIIKSERWKMGQLKAGDTIQFISVDRRTAEQSEHDQQTTIDTLRSEQRAPIPARPSPILLDMPADGECPRMVIRPSGDHYLLVELGPLELDIEIRLRIHLLMQALQKRDVPGIIDITPGIRSLQIHFEAPATASHFLELLPELLTGLPSVDDMEVESRIVHLPLSWDDPSTRLAIEKYTTSIRPGAPWCPDNIEFIRRINGLESADAVRDMVFDAHYLVLGLGDVYLGAPVATPVDPRHRLVTTKYNPARTWTPENAVGIGGAYLCIYGMEGPGGYQFVGRTIQMWNRYHVTDVFQADTPWLLRFFDQVRFYPVSADELTKARETFPTGRFPIHIEPTTFRLADYRRFLAEQSNSIEDFKAQQEAAFHEERQRWINTGQATYVAPEPTAPESTDIDLPDGCIAVTSPVAGNVWQVGESGSAVDAGSAVVVIESMKMEVPAKAISNATIEALYVNPGQAVAPGQLLAAIRPTS